MKNNFGVFAAAFGLFLSVFASNASANYVVDGDFSSPYGGTYTTYSASQSFGPWNVVSGSVDLIGGYWQNPTVGGGSVDLDGSSAGAFSQNINLTAGDYVLHFSLSGNPEGGDPLKGVQVSVGDGLQSFYYTTGSNTKSAMNYLVETLAFHATGPTSLLFSSLDASGSFWGAVIANVDISAVPLPAALPMFFSGLLGMFGFAKSRRKQKNEVSFA